MAEKIIYATREKKSHRYEVRSGRDFVSCTHRFRWLAILEAKMLSSYNSAYYVVDTRG